MLNLKCACNTKKFGEDLKFVSPCRAPTVFQTPKRKHEDKKERKKHFLKKICSDSKPS